MKKICYGLKIVGFSGLHFFLVILNELTFKCVIRFSRFVRILEDQWNGKKGSFF